MLAPSDDQVVLMEDTADKPEAQPKEAEEQAANTDKENQMPELQLQSREEAETNFTSKGRKKGDGKVKRNSKRQVSQL